MMSKDTKSVTSLLRYSITRSSSPGFPWRVRFHVQRRRPRDQRRNYKTRGGAWNKQRTTDFASVHFARIIAIFPLRFHSNEGGFRHFDRAQRRTGNRPDAGRAAGKLRP